MRVKAKHLVHANHEIESWASWRHLHTGENGIMGSLVSSYSPDRSDMPPHALVPRIDMPRKVSIVDIEYNDAPANHKKTIERKYLAEPPIKVSRYAEDIMLEYMAGRLLKIA